MGSGAVVDASALVELLTQTEKAAAISRALQDRELAAPDLLDLEVMSALRMLERRRVITKDRAETAFEDLRRFGIERVPIRAYFDDIWRLRQNVSITDAAYVVLSRLRGYPLVTADAKLTRAPIPGVQVIPV